MTIQKARLILGEKSEKLTDKEICEIISFSELLADATITTLKKELLQITSKNKN